MKDLVIKCFALSAMFDVLDLQDSPAVENLRALAKGLDLESRLDHMEKSGELERMCRDYALRCAEDLAREMSNPASNDSN